MAAYVSALLSDGRHTHLRNAFTSPMHFTDRSEQDGGSGSDVTDDVDYPDVVCTGGGRTQFDSSFQGSRQPEFCGAGNRGPWPQ